LPLKTIWTLVPLRSTVGGPEVQKAQTLLFGTGGQIV